MKNMQSLQSDWDSLYKSRAQQHWKKLSPKDLEFIHGSADKLSSVLMHHYGYSTTQAHTEIDTWLNDQRHEFDNDPILSNRESGKNDKSSNHGKDESKKSRDQSTATVKKSSETTKSADEKMQQNNKSSKASSATNEAAIKKNHSEKMRTTA